MLLLLVRAPLLSRELLLFDRRESERIDDDLVVESVDAWIAVRLDNIIECVLVIAVVMS